MLGLSPRVPEGSDVVMSELPDVVTLETSSLVAKVMSEYSSVFLQLCSKKEEETVQTVKASEAIRRKSCFISPPKRKFCILIIHKLQVFVNKNVQNDNKKTTPPRVVDRQIIL